MNQHETWLTPGFAQRIAQLHRVQLRDLYPSEAWSLYRVVPQCNNVLDLGCGSGAMADIVRAISPKTSYLGVDLSPVLVNREHGYPDDGMSRFLHADAFEFLDTSVESFDCIMSWAVLYALPDFETLLEKMVARSHRFVLFDMRVANVKDHVADVRLAYTSYDNVKAPYVIASFSALLEKLSRMEGCLKSVEIAGYDFPAGQTVWISDSLPQPSVLSVALEKRKGPPTDRPEPTDWYVKVPPKLVT